MDANDALTAAFAVTQTVSRAHRVADACNLVLDALSTVLPADRGAVLLLEEAGSMRFVAHRGLSDGYRRAVEGHSPWPADATDPQPIVIADVEADATLDARLRAVVLREGIRAIAFVPLVHDDRLLGKFMVYFDRPRVLAPTELTLARLVASQVAFAIARLRAEEAAHEARAELTAILESVPDGLLVHSADGRVQFVNEAMLGFVASSREKYVATPAEENAEDYEICDESGAPLPYAELPQRLARGGVASVRTFGFRPRSTNGPLRWTRVSSRPVFARDGSVRFAVTVVSDVTQPRREATGRQFLLEAGGLLASSLDYEATLASVTRLAVPRLADWCSVQVVGEDGELRTLSIEHVNPARVAFVHHLATAYPEDPDAPGGAHNVLRTGEPEVHNGITDEMLAASARDAEHLRLLRGLRLAAVMLVPMRARGRVLGVISFASSESGVRFEDHDLVVAMKLADRAAVAIDNARLYSEAQESRQRLAEERERLDVTLSSIGDAVIATDREGNVTLLNEVAQTLTGWSRDEAIGRPLAAVFPIFSEKTGLPVHSPVEKVLATGRIVGLANHTVLAARDGTRRAIADSAAPIRAHDGTIVGVVLVFRDVTQEQRLERELAKASKLESIGVLAGGIAHDFNNILTSISANVSLAERRLGPEDPARGRLAAAQVACERARDLTRQLLTFSRGGAPIRSATSVAATLREACGFALQGSSVRARYDVAEDVWAIDADAGQIAQVVHNIALNAAQAMPTGGNLRLAAENVLVDETSWLPLTPGPYVRVTLTDDGPGIPAENLTRIFDPFFTTKASGSGLGLATAYSVVKRHDGHLGVESTLGAGTTFSLFLPAADNAPLVAPVQAPAQPGRGRVLVMDDDAAIRELARECLVELGYECEVVSDGAEAIERYAAAKSAGRPFDVLMLDLTVPGGLGGKETLRRLEEHHPEVRAIVSSGYSNDPVMSAFREHGFCGVLQKPFVLDDLGRILSDVLTRPRTRR